MWQTHIHFYLVTVCVVWVSVQSTDIGDQVSEIVKTFANDGLGTGDMQDYIKRQVNFETEIIDEGTVAEIAEKMSDKITRRIGLLEDLQQKLEVITANSNVQIDSSGYYRCCSINPQGESSIHGDNVNLDQWCLLGDSLTSSDPPEHFLPLSALEEFKNVFDRDGDIKYVYFGSEDGVLYNYPGIKVYTCNSYDPRFRPWYVETATPESKDVVIVIDRSKSMRDSITSGDKSLMDLAKEAAITVVDTLNPNDRVGIVVFSDEAETPSGDEDTDTCYSTTLAKANPHNKDYLRRYIAYINADGDTFYNKALQKAFEYFKNTPKEDNGPREKVLLFLTDGEPTDEGAPNSTYRVLSQLNGELNNEVFVLTYLLSTATKGQEVEILTNLALQTYTNISNGEIMAGKFTHVTTPDNLRTEMAAYYRFFQSGTLNADPTFSVPFLDTFDRSSVQMSMCLPIKLIGNLKGGVVCMDQLVDDILSEVTYFRKGGLAYAFVIDGHARVLSHPLLTNPADVTNNPVFIDLTSLEFGSGIIEVRDSMVSGATGMKVLTSRRVIARGSLDTEGVNSRKVKSTYYWHPVDGTNFSVCIVKTNGQNYKRIDWNEDYPSVFSYHKNRIASSPSNTCKYFAREALSGQGNVKFAPRSFLNPYAYILGEETTSDNQGYKNYFTGKTNSNNWFRSDVRDHVAFSYKFEELMESRQMYGDYAVWRYIGTEAGVVRLYPGAEISTMYDPSLRSWYLRAMGSLSLYSISTPYIDAFGAGVVITLSKAMLSPSENLAVGVMGVDFTMPYFYYLLTADIPECSTYGCLVVDRSGFIILNSKWFEPGAQEIEHIEGIHISSVEPEIASDLASDGVLVSASCINMQELQEQKFWKMALSTVDNGFRSKTWYEIHEVADTNIFLLIKKGLPSEEDKCHCPSDRNNIELCSSNEHPCYCPCFTSTDVYSYCSGVFSLTIDGDPPCSPGIPSVDFSHLTATEEDIIKHLGPCRDYKCGQRGSREQCVGVASCAWCDSTGSNPSFCTTWGECHLGPQITETSPESDPTENTSEEAAPSWIIAVAVVGGVVLITVIIVTSVFIAKGRSAKEPIVRADTVPNQYSGLEHGTSLGEVNLAGPSTEEDSGHLKLEKDPIYDKLRESKLNLHKSSNIMDMQDLSARPKSDNLPPTPDEMPRDMAPASPKSKTLPIGLQGITDMYMSSIPPSPGPCKPIQSGNYSGLQSVASGSQQQGAAPNCSAVTDTIDDVYLKASSVPKIAVIDMDQGLPQGDGSQGDVYLEPASVQPSS